MQADFLFHPRIISIKPAPSFSSGFGVVPVPRYIRPPGNDWRASARRASAGGCGLAFQASENFHNAVVCHSYYAFAPLMPGVFMLVAGKRMDKSDPMSPDFAGNQALDDWENAMKKTEELEKINK
jgi:hypothetical protein